MFGKRVCFGNAIEKQVASLPSSATAAAASGDDAVILSGTPEFCRSAARPPVRPSLTRRRGDYFSPGASAEQSLFQP